MGSLNDKEKEFKSVLENLEFEINTDQLWEKVSPHLNDKKKDRPFFLYLLGLGFALLLGAVTVYMSMYKSDGPNSNGSLASLGADANSGLTTKSDYTKVVGDESAISIKQALKSEVNLTETKNNISTSVKENQIIKTNTLNNTLGKNINQVSSSPNRNSSKVSFDNLRLNVKKATSIFAAESKENTNVVYNKKKGNDILSNNNSNKINTSIIAVEQNSDNTLNTLVSSIEFLNMIDPMGLSIADRTGSFEFENNFNFIEVIGREDNKWQVFYTLYTGINKSISRPSLSSANSDFNTNEFNKESGLYGFSNGFEIGAENTSGWNVFGTLTHRSQHSVYQNSDILSETVSVTAQEGHIDVNGFLETQDVELLETTTTFNDINWNRRHSYIDIGVGIGKEIVRFGSLSLAAKSGLTYNLVSKHSGYYFDETSGGINKFKSNQDNPYNSNTGLAGNLAINLEWRYKNIGIGLSPYVQYRMGSILNDTNFYNIKDNNYGLNLSLSYRPL